MFRFAYHGNHAIDTAAGKCFDTPPPGLQSRYIMQHTATVFAIALHRATHRHRVCNRGTSCNTPPPFLQSRYIVQRVAGLVAVVIHGTGIHRGTHRAGLHAPTTHQPRKPGRVAVVIHRAGIHRVTLRAGLQLRTAPGRVSICLPWESRNRYRCG